MTNFTAIFILGGGILIGECARGGGATLPDVVVVGEEHGNPQYRRILLESLPGLLEGGYQTFASEKPGNLQEAVDRYIQASINLDDKARTRSLWEIAAVAVNRKVPSEVSLFDTHVLPEGERLAGALQTLVDAAVAGFDIALVDIDSCVISGYLQGGEGNHAVANALHSTLEARNRHMAGAVTSRTVLLVGRAHTGRDRSSVEHFLRQKGLTAVSIDLIGADNGRHPKESEDADFASTPDELAREGGILPYLKKRLPLPRAASDASDH